MARPDQLAPIPRALHFLARTTLAGLALVVGWIRRTGAPLADRGARALGHAVGNASLATLTKAWDARTIVFGVVARVGWWWSLWLAVRGAYVLLGVEPLGTERELLTPFAVGLAVAAAIAWLSPERHLRLTALLLGALHLALLATTLAALG